MNNTLTIWLLPLWIIGAPLVWAIVDRMRTPKASSSPAGSSSSMYSSRSSGIPGA